MALAVLALLSFHCSSTKTLTYAEKSKLDSHLIHLLESNQIDKNFVDETIRADGSKEYTVIVRADHLEEIKAMGVAVSSIFGDVIVVHATLEELRKIVSLPSVRSLEAGSKRGIQRPQ
jgi:hypothetical protein